MATSVQYHCERCARYLAESEIVTIAAADGRVRLPGCPGCRSFVRREEQEDRRPLERVVLREGLAPIWEPRNAPLLVATTVVGFGLSRFVPVAGALLALGVLCGYAAQVMGAAADPREPRSLGHAADYTGVEDLVGPILRRVVVLGVALAPLMTVVSLSDDPLVLAVGTIAGSAFYLLYVPAALIVAARARSFWTVLSPIAPLRIALRLGGDYLLVVGLHFGASLGGGLLVVGAFLLAGAADRYVAILPFLVAWAILVIVTSFQARVLGLCVREHRHVLGLSG